MARERVGGGFRPLALLWVLAALLGSAAPAAARPVVVYPPDGTSVTTPNINVYGAATERVEVVKLRANDQTLIPFIRPNRTFEQSIRLRPGVNEIQIGEYAMKVAFVTPKQPAPEGFVPRPVHQAIVKDCGACHTFPKPGDFSLREKGADMCLGCHADPALGKDGARLAIGHSPVTDDRDCLSCHAPHGGNGRGMVRKAVPSLCSDCHDSVTEGKGKAHSPVADGDCLACHRPHASANKGLLVAAGNALCLDCHDDPSTGLPVLHEAMGEGCGSCHAPHASKTRGLLAKPQAQVCGACHDVPAPSKGIVVHSPIADDKECTPCHTPHGGKVKKLLVREAAALCADCHDDVVAAGKAGGSVHPPAEEGACLDCHSPHSGPAGLLGKARSKLCLDCHDAFTAPEGGSLHAPAGDGECAECHLPHSSARKALLRPGGADLCLACHDRFEGDVVHAPVADGACTDCHRPHASAFRRLLVGKGMAVCLDCHDDPTKGAMRSLEGVVHRPILEDRECTPCHNPHAGRKALLSAVVPALCEGCHGRQSVRPDKRPYVSVHTPVADGSCMECHEPHSAPADGLLDISGSRDLCLLCHMDPAVTGGRPWTHSHPPVQKGCDACHGPHAGEDANNLLQETNALCRGCHKEEHNHPLDAADIVQGRKKMARWPENFPVNSQMEMSCSGCHEVHGSEYESMLKNKKETLCRGCHNV